MLIYSDTLTRSDLDAIAAQMPVTLFDTDAEFAGARHRRIKVLIRPDARGEQWRKVKVDQFTGRERRAFACSWDAHYVFYAALLTLDPSAEIKSMVAHWIGSDDYYSRVDDCGDDNWGSLFMPQYARQMCHCPMASSTLRGIGERIGNRVYATNPSYWPVAAGAEVVELCTCDLYPFSHQACPSCLAPVGASKRVARDSLRADDDRCLCGLPVARCAGMSCLDG